MDIQGGVRLVYRADFSSIPKSRATEQEKERLMALSFKRFGSRLYNFQGASLRVQRLGKDRIAVEIPGLRQLEDLQLDPDEQCILRQGRIASLSAKRDEEHNVPFQYPGRRLWAKVTDLIPLSEHVDYERIEVILANTHQIATMPTDQECVVYFPLHQSGKEVVLSLFRKVAETQLKVPGTDKTVPGELALFIDDKHQENLGLGDELRASVLRGKQLGQLVVTVSSWESGQQFKKVLSSGPMPLRFDLALSRRISPVVGTQLRQRGTAAILLSLLLLVAFMAGCYLKRPFFILVYGLSLGFWFFCLVILVNLHVIRLSLIQLAGFVLLLGMSTDALVLVFEDLRQRFAANESFRLDLSNRAFLNEMRVVIMGALTTLVVVVPLAMAGEDLQHYVTLLAWGIGVNIAGYAFAWGLMSTGTAQRYAATTGLSTDLSEVLGHVRHQWVPYTWPGVALAVGALIAVVAWSVPKGPVFGGGSVREITFPEPVKEDLVREGMAGHIGPESKILVERGQEDDDTMARWVCVISPPGTAYKSGALLDSLRTSTGVDPALSDEEEIGEAIAYQSWVKTAWWFAIALFLLAMVCWYRYGLAAIFMILALAHDMALCLGLMAVLRIHLNFTTVAALATIAGYSVNDSIVILEKLRQSIKSESNSGILSPADLKDLREENLKTLTPRILITTITTAAPMFVVWGMAGGMLADFSLLVAFGVLVGTLSSVYIVGRAPVGGSGLEL